VARRNIWRNVYKNTYSLPNYVIQVFKAKLPIDVELLIELYRSEEGLWDSGNANYLNTRT